MTSKKECATPDDYQRLCDELLKEIYFIYVNGECKSDTKCFYDPESKKILLVKRGNSLDLDFKTYLEEKVAFASSREDIKYDLHLFWIYLSKVLRKPGVIKNVRVANGAFYDRSMFPEPSLRTSSCIKEGVLFSSDLENVRDRDEYVPYMSLSVEERKVLSDVVEKLFEENLVYFMAFMATAITGNVEGVRPILHLIASPGTGKSKTAEFLGRVICKDVTPFGIDDFEKNLLSFSSERSPVIDDVYIEGDKGRIFLDWLKRIASAGDKIHIPVRYTKSGMFVDANIFPIITSEYQIDFHETSITSRIFLVPINNHEFPRLNLERLIRDEEFVKKVRGWVFYEIQCFFELDKKDRKVETKARFETFMHFINYFAKKFERVDDFELVNTETNEENDEDVPEFVKRYILCVEGREDTATNLYNFFVKDCVSKSIDFNVSFTSFVNQVSHQLYKNTIWIDGVQFIRVVSKKRVGAVPRKLTCFRRVDKQGGVQLGLLDGVEVDGRVLGREVKRFVEDLFVREGVLSLNDVSVLVDERFPDGVDGFVVRDFVLDMVKRGLVFEVEDNKYKYKD